MCDQSGSSYDDIQYSNSDSNSDSDSSDRAKPVTGIIKNIANELATKGMVSDRFIQLEIHERLKITAEMLNSYEPLLKNEPIRIPKSNSKSHDFAVEGITEYSKGNRNKALVLYNKSIAFAEIHYPYLHTLYQRRANALCDMKLFAAALHSLELAIRYWPTDSMAKDYEKQKADLMRDCNNYQSMAINIKSQCQTDIDSLTTIKSDRINPNVPFIANCLQLNDTPNYGRGIFTTCDLNPGDVVATDRAYASILISKYPYRHCTNCLRENWSLIPCPECTTAMYCNEKCLQIAWKKFHKHECKISNYLMKIFPDLSGFRTPLQTIVLLGGIDRLIEFENTYQRIGMESFDIFNVDHDDDGEIGIYDGNQNFNSRMTASNYHPVHELILDVPEPQDWSIQTYSRTALRTLLIYRLFRDIFKITTDEQQRFVEKFIYRHVRAARIYYYGLFVERRKKRIINYASALYPFASLLNHSCAPNMMLVMHGSSVTAIVLHPIKAGEQLFYYYGPHYGVRQKAKRLRILSLQWDIKCQCIACTEDYPLKNNLPSTCIPYELKVPFCTPPTKLKFKELIESIKVLFMFRHSHLHMFPCKDTYHYEDDVIDYVSHLLRRLSGAVLMNY